MKQKFCVFEFSHQKVYFVDSFDLFDDANFLCGSLNNSSRGLPCRFIVRCLDKSELDLILGFLGNNLHKDISSVYEPFISRIFVRA